MSIPWTQGHCYAFPPFCLIPRVLNKIQQDQVHTVTLITPCWQTQLWYPQVLKMLIRRPILIPSSTTLLVDPKGNPHSLVLNKILILVTWQVSVRDYLSREFLRKQPSLLGNYESAWKNWSGWCESWNVDPFRCPVNYVLEHLSSLFYHEKLLYRTIGYIDQPFLPIMFTLMTSLLANAL